MTFNHLLRYPVCMIALLAMTSFACQKNSGDDEEQTVFLKTDNTYTHVSTDQFTWITGNNAWIQDSKNRLESSKFVFKSDGNLVYTFDFDNANTYTLTGKYYKNGSSYSFEASRNTNNGAGSGTQVLIVGTANPLSGSKLEVDMEYGSSANYSAVVNNQQFLNQSSKRFRTVMTIR